MAYIPDTQENTGSFVQTTFELDVQTLYATDVTSPEFKELLSRLYQSLIYTVSVVNTKNTAFFFKEEINTSGLYFNPDPTADNILHKRQNYRTTVDTGILNAGVTIIPHGITPTDDWNWTHIYGAATDSFLVRGVPLPYASADGTHNISVDVDATNITITNNSGINFTSSSIVLEYVKF